MPAAGWAVLGKAAPVILSNGIDFLFICCDLFSFRCVAGHQVDEGEQQTHGAGRRWPLHCDQEPRPGQGLQELHPDSQ